MTTPATPPGERNVRGLGWDIDSSFSSNRGELLPLGSFGHTGFTGTSLWIDPATRDVRRVPVEPRAPGRAGGRDAAARARRDRRGVGDRRRAGRRPQPACSRDVISARRDRRRPAPPCDAGADRHRRASGRAASRRSAASASGSSRITPAAPATARRRSICCSGAKDVKLVALFSPEHGIRGILDASVPSDDRREDRAADPLALRRDAAADRRDARGHRRDRHRPAGHRRPLLHLHDDDGVRDGGGGEAEDRRSSCSIGRTRSTASRSRARRSTRACSRFTGYFPAMPIRHGMTLGELAKLFNAREQDRRRPHRRGDEELAPRSLVRRRPACPGSTRRRTCAT